MKKFYFTFILYISTYFLLYNSERINNLKAHYGYNFIRSEIIDEKNNIIGEYSTFFNPWIGLHSVNKIVLIKNLSENYKEKVNELLIKKAIFNFYLNQSYLLGAISYSGNSILFGGIAIGLYVSFLNLNNLGFLAGAISLFILSALFFIGGPIFFIIAGYEYYKFLKYKKQIIELLNK